MVENDVREIDTREKGSLGHPAVPKSSASPWLIGLIVFAVFAGALISGVRSRARAQATLHTVTQQMAMPSVSVVRPKQSEPAQEIILPGNIQPFISSPIYARTDGYLKKWYFDIGAHVKAGELLAVIESPEIDQQLVQARATLDTARANLELSR